ncbi:MAG: OadG family protein [Mobilitalea sp.]
MNTLSSVITNQTIRLSSNFNNFSDYININNLFIAVLVLAFIILIMCVTYFISIKPNLNQNTSGTTSVKTIDITKTNGLEGKNLVDDSELVAVITAAIYASMGDEVPAGGFVVRSIHRTNNKWMNS